MTAVCLLVGSAVGAALWQASPARSPHWPGAVPALGAAALLVVTWSASLLAATRRDTRSASTA
jgi:H+/Cl- antiporter ClcA